MRTVIVEILESDVHKLEKFILIESHPAIVEFVKSHVLPTELDDCDLKKLIDVCKNAVSLNQSFDGVRYEVHTEYDFVNDDSELWNQLIHASLVKECRITDIKTKDLLAAIDNYEF